MIGIYKITSPDGKVYIGSSTDIERRIYQHKMIDGNKKVQKSFYYYGIENHLFETIIECAESELNKYERHYQDLYDSCENGLNIHLTNPDKIRVKYMRKEKPKKRPKVIVKVLICNDYFNFFGIDVIGEMCSKAIEEEYNKQQILKPTVDTMIKEIFN